MSIRGYESKTENMEFGVSKGSILGPINDLLVDIKYSLVHHFADDTRVLLNNKSLKQLQKHINIDL